MREVPVPVDGLVETTKVYRLLVATLGVRSSEFSQTTLEVLLESLSSRSFMLVTSNSTHSSIDHCVVVVCGGVGASRTGV